MEVPVPSMWLLLACVAPDAAPSAVETTDTADPLATVVTSPFTTDTATIVDRCTRQPLVIHPGVGLLTYTPIVDGDVLQIVHFAEGGFYFDGALALDGTHPSVQLQLHMTTSTGEVLTSDGPYAWNISYLRLNMLDQCSGTVTGVRGYFDAIPYEPYIYYQQNVVPVAICALAGQEIDLRWEALDLFDGRTGEGSVRVVVALDPVDLPACSQWTP